MIFSVNAMPRGHENICMFLWLKSWFQAELDGVIQTETTFKAGNQELGILAKASHPCCWNIHRFVLALGFVLLPEEQTWDVGSAAHPSCLVVGPCTSWRSAAPTTQGTYFSNGWPRGSCVILTPCYLCGDMGHCGVAPPLHTTARAGARDAQWYTAALFVCYAAILNGTWDFELFQAIWGISKVLIFTVAKRSESWTRACCV